MAQKGTSGDASAALGLALRPRYWPPAAPPPAGAPGPPCCAPSRRSGVCHLFVPSSAPPTRPPPHTHTPSSVTGAGGPCHPGNMSYLSGDQQLPEGSFGGAGALSCVPCALNSCSRAPPACSVQVAGRGDSCSPDLSTNAHAPLGRTGVPGRPGPPPTRRSHPTPRHTRSCCPG